MAIAASTSSLEARHAGPSPASTPATAPAAFEAFVQDLNRALQAKKDKT